MRESSNRIETDGVAVREHETITEPVGLERKQADLIELLLVLARRKKTILQITIAAALLALIISLLVPPMYTASTTILPPQQSQSALSSMLGQLGAIAGLNESDLGFKNPADLFIVMLRSRTIGDRLVDRFDLRQVYRVKRYQDARKQLDALSDIVAEQAGLISIKVTDRDPKRAADLANAYVEELHAMNSNLAFSEASQRRLFYQQKLDAERDGLAQAELALKQVQEKSGLFQPDAQGRAIIDAVEGTRAQVAIKEVQLQAMRTYATPNNPDLKRAEQELSGLRAELAKLERNPEELGNGNPEIPTRRLPEVQLLYVRRARDLKYHEALYEFLSKQLEAAQIDEAKEAIVMQVVDKAVVPDRKSSPRRTLIVLVTALVAFVFSCLWVLLTEAVKRKQQDPQERERLALLRHSLKFSSWKS